MRRLLNKPYPFFLGKRETFKVIFLIGLFVFLVCILFKPFGLNIYSFNKLFLLSVINGIVVTISLLISQRLFSFFFRNQNEDNWTVLKEITSYFWHFFFLSVFIFLFNYSLDTSDGNALGWFVFSLTRLLLASLVVTPIVILLKRNFILFKNSTDEFKISRTISQDIKKKHLGNVEIELISNNKKDNLLLDKNKIILFKASENYVEVVFINNNKVKFKLLRNTLKNICSQIDHHECFFQCHRSFIINLDKLESFSGNAKGYLIKLAYVPEKVPVSRSSISQFKKSLRNFKK